MYESKYSKYITKSKTRFAEPEEIKGCCEPVGKKQKTTHAECRYTMRMGCFMWITPMYTI